MKHNDDINRIEALKELAAEGFLNHFEFSEGILKSKGNIHRNMDAEEVTISKCYHLRTYEDEDKIVVYAIESQYDEKGVLLVNYGSNIDMELISFLNKVKVKVT